jgi:hypothetical protein
MDSTGIMHGFFGDDWRQGVGPLHECERRNYLFAAKSVGWANVKRTYDMSSHETVPYLKPLQNVQPAEIEGAEGAWSRWLAMEDWMVGPRAPIPGLYPRALSQGSKSSVIRLEYFVSTADYAYGVYIWDLGVD